MSSMKGGETVSPRRRERNGLGTQPAIGAAVWRQKYSAPIVPDHAEHALCGNLRREGTQATDVPDPTQADTSEGRRTCLVGGNLHGLRQGDDTVSTLAVDDRQAGIVTHDLPLLPAHVVVDHRVGETGQEEDTVRVMAAEMTVDVVITDGPGIFRGDPGRGGDITGKTAQYRLRNYGHVVYFEG